MLRQTDQESIYFSLKTLIARVTCAAVLSCSSAVAQAQLSGFPEFLEKHFRAEATGAKDGPKLHSQFDYTALDTLVTSSLVKMNNDGFENHMAVGIVQNFGTTSAKVTYNLHRYNFSDREDQSDDITLDFHYRSLRVQHRIEDTARVSTIGLPFDLFAAQLDLSFSQTLEQGSADTIDVYQFVSQFNRLKFAATWKNTGDSSWADFSTEYRPWDYWLMKISYTDGGVESQRQFRSEYTARGYRLAGEYKTQTDGVDQNHVTGAISIEKDTDLAALKLRLEYDENLDGPAFFFKVESDDVF